VTRASAGASVSCSLPASLPGSRIVPKAPIVALVPTPGDRGYWELGSDGGVLSFGDAPFLGSVPALHLIRNAAISSIAD
jgi:hypothetical protein